MPVKWISDITRQGQRQAKIDRLRYYPL